MSRVGISDAERTEPREIIINTEIETDCDAAAGTDDIANTVDYSEIAAHVEKFVTSREFHLIESIAAGLLENILSIPRVKRARVEVEKPEALATSDAVSVCTEGFPKKVK